MVHPATDGGIKRMSIQGEIQRAAVKAAERALRAEIARPVYADRLRAYSRRAAFSVVSGKPAPSTPAPPGNAGAIWAPLTDPISEGIRAGIEAAIRPMVIRYVTYAAVGGVAVGALAVWVFMRR